VWLEQSSEEVRRDRRGGQGDRSRVRQVQVRPPEFDCSQNRILSRRGTGFDFGAD
jgi:hypothetical protein